MFDLTLADYIYVGVLLASTIWATVRGGVYETIATLSWILAAISARFASPWVDRLIQMVFGMDASSVVSLVASYFVVFCAVLLLVGFVNQRLRDKIRDSIMNVTDKTLGVIFGIIRGIVIMGLLYWGALLVYADRLDGMPSWIADAQTRQIMQTTASKLDEWFVPGGDAAYDDAHPSEYTFRRVLQRDEKFLRAKQEIDSKHNLMNLINPAVSKDSASGSGEKSDDGVGYTNAERVATENQLLQIATVARAIEEHESKSESDTKSE